MNRIKEKHTTHFHRPRRVVGIPFWEILKLVLGFDSAQPNRFDSVDAPRLTRVGEWGLGVGRGPRLGSDAEGELS